MQILKDLWNNIVAAAFAAILVAVIQLITHGEHLGQATNAWFLLFFIAFTVGDIITWAWRKYRG